MKSKELVIITIFIFIALISSSIVLISPVVTLAIVLSLATAIIIFFNPFIGLIIYITFLCLKPHRLIPASGKLHIMLILATVIFLIFLVHKIFRREKIHIFSTRQHIFMFILLIIIPVSNIVNFRLVASLEGFRDFLTVYLLFFMITSIADDFSKFRIVCWTLVSCTAVLAVNGIIQHFKGVDLLGYSPIVGRIRGAGLFTDPNDFALLINTFLPFILVNLFDKGIGKFTKLILFLVGISCVTAIYYTNSRGGFIALLAILLFFSYKKWGLLKGVALGAVFLICAIILAPSRLSEASMLDDSSIGRINAWRTGLSLLKSHPFLGIGYDNFLLFNRKVAHSAFVNCFAELGLIGYFIWLALIYTCFSDLGKIEKSEEVPPHYKKYAKTLQISAVGFLSSAIFLSQTYTAILYILVALTSLNFKNASLAFKKQRILSRNELIIITTILVASIFAFQLITMIYFLH